MGCQMQHDYVQLRGGAWAEINPFKCPCGGRGWMLSDLDTWHRCRIHNDGQGGHPADDDDDDAPEVAIDKDWLRKVVLKAAADFMAAAARNAPPGTDIKTLVVARFEATPRTMRDWVEAAEAVAEEAKYDADCALAAGQGYGSPLEMRWADEAEREARERAGY